jgi:PST family polysaccharide transporter
MGEAIIQREELEEAHISTAFWSTVVMGAAVFLLLWAGSGLVARFYQRPEVASVLTASAFIFVISTWGAIHRALLRRDLKLRQLAYVEASASILSAAGAIGMALTGFGVWSLVVRGLLRSLFTVIGLWITMSWRPGFLMSGSHFMELFGFSRNVVGGRFLRYANSNLDYLIVGKLIGTVELGWYTVAFNVAMLLRTYLSQIVNSVAFPAFSRAGRARLGSAYLRTTSYVALIALPGVAVVGLLAPEIVGVVLGPDWLPMVTSLRLLTVAGGVASVSSLSSPVFFSSGRVDIQVKWQLTNLVSLVPTLLIGARWGINGVAAAWTIRILVLLPVIQLIINRIAGVSWRDYIGALWRGFAVSASVSATLLVLRFADSTWLHLGDFVLLVVGGVVAVLVTLISVLSLASDMIVEVLGVLPSSVSMGVEGLVQRGWLAWGRKMSEAESRK